MQDVAFTETTLELPANTDVTLVIHNNGALTHTFDLDELNVHSGELAGGESKTITFNTGAAGTYEYYCAVPGHRESGMVGTLTVK
jgi:nitrite reductase (NO-forming)